DQRGLTIWDVQSGQPLDTVNGIHQATEFSPDWRFLLVYSWGPDDRTSYITFLDLASHEQTRIRIVVENVASHWSIRLAPDSTRFVIWEDIPKTLFSRQTVKVQLWQLMDGPKVQLLQDCKHV